MDWLNQAKRFLGGLFGGAQKTIGQISGNVARAVGQAEQQAARTAQQAVQRFIPQAPQAPRIQLPKVNIQPPKVQLPQAPRVDLGALTRALQGTQQQVGRTLGQFGEGMNIGLKQFTGQQLTPKEQQVINVAKQMSPILKTTMDLQKGLRESDQAIRQRQIQSNKEFVQQFKTSPATAIFTMPALSPFGNIAQGFKQFKVATGKELPKFDTTKAVEDLSNTLAKTPLRKVPGMGTVGDIVKPLAISAARMADVAQTQEQYSNGIKGLGEMGVDIANIGSLLYTGGLSKQLAAGGAKAFLPTAAKLAPRLAASGAGQNILNQLAQGKKFNEIDPKEVIAAAALYTGLGVGIPAATVGVGTIAKKITGKATQALPLDKNASITVGTLPEKGALRAQGYTNVKVQFTPQPGQVAPTMRGVIPQVAPKAPKGQEALFAEARKYKSAEEFVKAQGQPLYHGTTANFDMFNPAKLGKNTGAKSAKEGFFFTPQKEVAQTYISKGAINTNKAINELDLIKLQIKKLTGDNYSQANNKMIQEDLFNRNSGYSSNIKKQLNVLLNKYDKTETKINKIESMSTFNPEKLLQADKKSKVIEAYPKLQNSYIYDAKGAQRTISDYTNIIKKAKQDGYDSVVIKNTFDRAHTFENSKPHDVVIVFNEKNILTKQQLTDIYNQANKPTIPVKPIYETAPKPGKVPQGEASLSDIQVSVAPKRPKVEISPKAQELKAQFLNRFDSVERFVRNVELERGSKLKPSENPMYYVKQFMGGGGIANYRIDNELTPILKQTKNFDGLRQYLIARRMNELADRGIGKKANTAIAELTQKYGPDEIANFDKISTQLYAYQRNQLDQLLATGVISKQSYDNIIAKNQFYIPFNRVIPDVIAETTQGGQKISGAKKLGSLKAIKGSEKEIIDPIESLIKNTYDVQATVAKQKVLNSLVALAPDEFKPLAKNAGLKAPAIELFSNGKRIKLSADPQLAKALNAMDEEQLNLVVRAMSLPAKALRAGATSLNVAFAIPNVLRDQLSAAVNSKYGGVPIYDFVSGLASVIKKDDSYKKWLLSGADQATLFSQDRTTLMRGVKDITGGVGYKTGKLVKSPLELFRIFGDLSEKGSRLGVFKRALKGATKEGLKPEDALLTAMRESREATIDFAQRGSKMKAFNAMVPFLNARVQGTYKLAQSFKQRPVQTMMRGAAIASVPAVILYIHNNADGNKQIYSEIPDYIKRENFIIVTGDKNTPFIKIPKGEVGKIFANPVESFMAQINNDSTNWSDTAKSLADAFLPIGSVSEPSRFLTDLIPTAIGVPLQIATNYDIFRGQNIVGQYQKDLPAAQQYNRYNTETAKKLGELLNISPAQIEFALGGYTGGLGRQGLQVADIAQGKVPAVQELPVLSRFLGEQKDLSASAQEIYKQAEKAKQEKAKENFAIKKALEKGDTSVLEGLDKTTATRLKRSVAEEQAKKDLSPVQKALFDLPTAQLEALKQTGQYTQDIAAIENIKNKISESLTKPKAVKVTKPKLPKTPKARKGRAGRITAKRVSLKAPRVRRIKVAAPKARKISFKQPTPTKARKTIKIKTG